MSERREETLPATRPKSRKSLAHLPSAEGTMMDKENMTTDLGALSSQKRSTGERAVKKSRSKSIGPGGLDALQDSAGNRRASLLMPPPRSILKPTMPPLREIPAHVSMRKLSPKKAPQPQSSPTVQPNLNIASVGPKQAGTGDAESPDQLEVDQNAAVAETRVVLRTEEQQQATAREREEQERKAMEKDVNARRDARRKSLANRRVSFAPEATLHTWDVVEYMQDSTTSSASTNSTRRASSASSLIAGSPHPQSSVEPSSDQSEPPSTPPEQVEDTTAASPAHQRDLHQRKRRRSSGIPPLNFNNPDDEVFSSSPSEGSSVGEINEDEAFMDGDENSDSNSDSDDDGTAMSLDAGDTTNMSVASVRSVASSTGSSARLEEALSLAARQAGTQGVDFDQDEEDEEDEIMATFKPWAQKADPKNMDSLQDQENLNPFSPAFKAGSQQNGGDQDDEDGATMEMTMAVGHIIQAEQSDDEMTMDMTVAIGGIVKSSQREVASRRKSVVNRRQSTRRRSSGGESLLEDGTMDLTMAIGGIKTSPENVEENDSDDEEMTMEFTTVIGGVLAPGKTSSGVAPRDGLDDRRRSVDSNMNDVAMDMTVPLGRIVSRENANSFMASGKATTGTPVSTPKSPARSDRRSAAKRVMELELDTAEPFSSPFQPIVAPSMPEAAQVATAVTESGSPGIQAFRGKGLRRSGGPRASINAKESPSKQATPVKKPNTPSKQITPKPTRPTTPAKTPPSKNISMRKLSPKRLFVDEPRDTILTPKPSSISTATTPNKLFQSDSRTGVATPSFVLKPQKRRSSGLGIDKAGLGSPRAAAILDRRVSIGETAVAFSPGQFRIAGSGVRFGESQEMELELDQKRREDADREDRRKIMENEADNDDGERDATINLKEMIQSLTPKKRSLKGRKSLHVGAAKGILGKRPAELDEDEEEEDEEGGVKRLKNHQGSPVKNVKLRPPPTMEETTGRLTRSTRRSLENITGNITTPVTAPSPLKGAAVATPRGKGRFKDADVPSATIDAMSSVDMTVLDDSDVLEDRLDVQIPLQDFLNMTSIRFMELTTTKRRHTIAPKGDLQELSKTQNGLDDSFQSCVVAGACTVPMLELFEHSCRELKKYISGGRSVVRELEAVILEENPALFREYISAAPDVKILMDNQFKNVKTQSRLLSKEMWYNWRMDLLKELREGLLKTGEGMQVDMEVLQSQQQLIDFVLPGLVSTCQQLTEREADLRAAADDLANCDQDELRDARERLLATDEEIMAKKQMIEQLRAQVYEKETRLEVARERKQVCLDDIRAAEKIREECRGWTGKEIMSLKAKVDALEREHGWTITGISGTTTSLSYRSELELVFDASSFRSGAQPETTSDQANTRIDLWYIAGNRELNPLPVTAEKEFFLQNIRERCRCLPQAKTSIRDLLNVVSASWTKALKINDEISALSLDLPTTTTKTSDNAILVSSSLLLKPLATKVEFKFHMVAVSTGEGVDIEVFADAAVVYGERFNEKKMGEFILSRIGNETDESRASWSSAVLEMEEKLLARGRK